MAHLPQKHRIKTKETSAFYQAAWLTMFDLEAARAFAAKYVHGLVARKKRRPKARGRS